MLSKVFSSKVARLSSFPKALFSNTVIGIDLGTTNSCVAIMEGGQPKVIENTEGIRTTPSIVGFAEDGQVLVGEAAKRQAVTNPENTVYASKRLIGRLYSDPATQKDAKHLAYKVVSHTNGDAWISVRGKSYSPSQIASYILNKMRDSAENYLGTKVTSAVITVPAYFNDSQRNATKDAGLIAGLDVQRIINEPTAAALAYGLERKEGKIVAVYDLGGGTFDISILELKEGVFQVLATNGDTSCGGEDIDAAIQQYLIQEFKTRAGVDVSGNRLALQRIKEAAEKAKIELSSVSQTDINLPYLAVDAKGAKHLEMKLTRKDLEQIADNIIQRTIAPCEKCMKDSGIQKSRIDDVILVGGMTRMPKVQETVRKLFGKTPNKGVNPDEAVALGAAVQGGVLTGSVKDILLVDVTPLSLGVDVVGDIFVRMINRNTAIPTQKVKEFTTMQDMQSSVAFGIYQGEREIASENKKIGQIVLDGIAPAPKGVPKILTTFQLDANGILHVTAKDKATGRDQRVVIQGSSGLTPAEIEKMIKAAEKMKAADERRKAEVENKRKAEEALYNGEKQLSEHKEKLSAELIKEVETVLAELRAAVDGNNAANIDQAVEKTNQALMKIGSAVYGGEKKQ
eukprot:CAMPEP_0176433714 /NCGR_PEP_ID=MMETSP0127-20121128/16203_1 /TAXON_ID=938130 /ORGANISM="Platyophrya macrostoma, Strain WH" /LENGTH=625 /DNA_ID=CAMNT_0017816227 /DNA_START=51 /DNA_END=1928 /DNA_ORIENTATION=-